MNLWNELSKRGRNMRLHELTRLFGENTGVLLSQLLYWYCDKEGKCRAQANHEGKAWIARTTIEWMMDTGLSEWKLRTAFKHLENLNLIEKGMFFYNRVWTRHIWLDIESLTEWIARIDSEEELEEEQPESSTPSGGCLKGVLRNSHPYTIYKEVEKSLKTASKNEAINPDAIEEDRETTKPNQSQKQSQNLTLKKNLKKPPNLGKRMKIEEMMKMKKALNKNLEENEEELVEPEKITNSWLALFWKKRVSQVHKVYQTDLGGKWLGKLKDLIKKQGAEEVYIAMKFYIENTGLINKELKKNHGIHSPPNLPEIWVFCTYYGVTVHTIAQEPISATKNSVPTKNSVSTKNSNNVVPTYEKPAILPSTQESPPDKVGGTGNETNEKISLNLSKKPSYKEKMKELYKV